MKDIFSVSYETFGQMRIHDFKVINPDTLAQFVLRYTYEIIEKTACCEDEILLCIPKYLIEYLSQDFHDKIPHIKICSDMTFCGIKVQVNPENNATLFYNSIIPEQIIKYTLEL